MAWRRTGSRSRISGKFHLAVVQREATKPGKARPSCYEHFFLVVLQQYRSQCSCRHCIVRSVSRCAIPLACLDLQP